MAKPIIISLGGSIIVPDKIDIKFLISFKNLILEEIKKNKKFIIICGGGNIAREYQKAAFEVNQVTKEDQDWLGIHATRLNAHLLRTIFRKWAYPVILDKPQKSISNYKKEPILIAAGWRPGFSTDFVSVLLAKRFNVDKVINASNISFVYDKDFKKYKDAQPIKEISWKDYQKLIPSKWDPGLRVPFDPIAAREAKKLKMKVFILDGRNLKNLKLAIEGKDFQGTIIK
ncbi:MAG: UMP kinase [Candidatus Pacebacteria bacterium]|nr:UMP kinase [Candidatus Paceibacterota bacterium]